MTQEASNNRKVPYFMTFYENIAILNQVFNVETKFYIQLMANSNRDMVIHLTPSLKEEIMVKIGSKSGNMVKAADKHLSSLKRKGVIETYGRGAYMVHPQVNGYSNAHKSIVEKTAKFLELRFGHSENGNAMSEINLTKRGDINE